MGEIATRSVREPGWNGEAWPLLDAAQAALERGPLDAASSRVTLSWKVRGHKLDVVGDLGSARDALAASEATPRDEVVLGLDWLPESVLGDLTRVGRPPEEVAIRIAYGKHDEASVSIRASRSTVFIDAGGSDWPRTLRAFDASCEVVRERGVGRRTAVARTGVLGWVEQHPALVALIVGLAAAVATVVAALVS